MKAKLTFNLPEDNEDFRDAVDGGKWKSLAFEFDQKLRSMYKYEEKETVDTEELRQLFRDMILEYGLNLD
mgnify:CR=1 FL=1